MVGVAGRSKGCFTCRSRRVKCDEARPECQRCKKAGRICGGYREIDFIDGLPSAVRKEADKMRSANYATNSLLEAASDSSSSSSSSSSSWADRSSREGSKPPIFDVDDILLPVVQKRRLHSVLSFESVPLSPSLLPFEDLIYLSYTQTNLMKGGNPLGYTNGVDAQTETGAQLTRSSILSLSTVFFGIQHHQNPTLQSGMQRYGATLKILNNALADPKMSHDLGVLRAIMILGIYEFLLPTSALGWIDHALGLERLILHRGPQAHCMPPARNLYESVRGLIIFASLSLDRPTALAESDWKTIPWILEPEMKQPMQYLFDILVDVPSIFRERERLVELSAGFADIASDRAVLERRIKDLVTILDSWQAEWWAEHEHDLLETNDFASLKPEDDKPLLWEKILHFSSLHIAHEYAVYNGTRVMLSTTLRSTKMLDLDENSPEIHELAMKARGASIEICRSVDYHLLEHQVGAGSLFLLFPLRMAWQGLGGSSSREGQWLEEITKQISRGKKGWWESAGIILHHPLSPGEMDETSVLRIQD